MMTRASVWYLGPRLFLFALLLIPVLEISVRLWLPQQLITPADIYAPDYSGLGMRIAPNLDRIINTGEQDVHYVTDANGYRVADQSASPGGMNVLALGDSFLQALQVDYADTMTARLEVALTAALQQPVRIVNTGAGAYSPNQYALLAKQEVAAHPYDLILVFVYTGNDLIDAPVAVYDPIIPNYRDFRWPQSFTWSEIVQAVLYPINNLLEQNAHLYILLKTHFSARLAQIGLTASYFPNSLLGASADKNYWAVTADVLAQIQTTAHAANIPIIYVLLPSSYQIMPEELAWAQEAFGITPEQVDLQQPTARLLREMQARELTTLDMYPPLAADYAQRGLALYGQVDSHLSAAGHQVVADQLFGPVLAALSRGR